ncbi:MAG: hypothetical protein U0324_35630 [Polyangiales bacterium]
MSVDDAFDRFLSLRGRVPPEDDLPLTNNEACTRLHLIDPMLTEVLEWPRELIAVEVASGEPDDEDRAGASRLDYALRDAEGVCWFVIEAKKRTRPLMEATGDGRMETLKLAGPVLKRGCWPIIERQMPPYLGRFMPIFGAVTTGEQWVAFLNKARPDEVPLDQTHAAVFRSLDAVAKDFERFYNIFGFHGARRRTLLQYVEQGRARGVLHAPSARRVVPTGEERLIDHQGADGFYRDLKLAMDGAFRALHDDRAALVECFVESRESRDASDRLERVANELGDALRDASEYPEDVRQQADQVAPAAVQPLDWAKPGQGYLARIIGERSAGKTVFLRRVFDVTLTARRERIFRLWIDVETLDPFDANAASRDAFEQLKLALFGEEGPSWAHLREVYRREWVSRTRLLAIDGDGTPEHRAAFLQEMLDREARDPAEALRRYAEFATLNRRHLVCVVVDNLDHLSDPSPALTWALARYRAMFALVTVAMEDATLWRLRGAGRDVLDDQQPEQFWLHRPKVREVIERRVDHLRRLVGEAPSATGRSSTNVGRHGQWRWTVAPEQLVRVVSTVLLQDDTVVGWIGQLANHDLREVLNLCRRVVLSPHIRTAKLLSMHVTEQVSRQRVLRALVASPRREQYLAEPTDPVANVFGFWLESDWAPLLPARLLVFLRTREDDARNRRETFGEFIAVERLMEGFAAEFGVPRPVLCAALEALSARMLVEPFNPADRALADLQARVKITPRGRLHLDWALREATYVRLMAEVDPVVDDAALATLRDRRERFMQAVSSRADGGYDKAAIAAAERAFTSAYVAYVLAAARRVTPSHANSDYACVARFEHELAQAHAPAKS